MSVIVYQFQTVKFIQMMSLTFGLFTQVSGSGPLGPLVFIFVHNFLVLFSLNWKNPFFYRTYSETGCRKPRLIVENCCNFFKHCYFYSVQTRPKR